MKPFKHSLDLEKISPALIAAQAEIPKIPKKAYNPFLKYSYADLADILDAVRPILAKHELMVHQSAADGYLHTRIVHSSGQWQQNSVPCLQEEKRGLSEMQTVGVSVTYARRYGLMMALNIMAEDDTDAATPQHHQPQHRAAAPPPSQAPKPAPKYSKLWLVNRALQLGYSGQDIADHVKAMAGETQWDDLTNEDKQDIYNALKKKETVNG